MSPPPDRESLDVRSKSYRATSSMLSADFDSQDYDIMGEIGRGHRSIVYKAVCVRGRLYSRLLALKKVTKCSPYFMS